jgi:hypothetical protein
VIYYSDAQFLALVQKRRSKKQEMTFLSEAAAEQEKRSVVMP